MFEPICTNPECPEPEGRKHYVIQNDDSDDVKCMYCTLVEMGMDPTEADNITYEGQKR